MKRCPECRRDYFDDSLLYCLDDGSALLEGPASNNEQKTAILSRSAGKETRMAVPGSESRTDILGAAIPLAAVSRLRPSAKQMMAGGLILLLAAAFSYMFVIRPGGITAPSAGIRSLAVLPLENLSGDPSQEYFADGMTDALISHLAQIHAFNKVISRTSVMQYKGSRSSSLPEIARELGVDAVIEGSVQKTGGHVHVSARLVPAAADSPTWAREYDRDESDVLKLQSEIARTVADEIRIQMTAEERTRLSSAPSIDPQAQEAYLLGRYYANKYNEKDAKKAIEYFQRAIELAPDNAAAYAGLSDVWFDRFVYGMPFREVEGPARAAAARAIELDEQLPEPHISLAKVKLNFDLDWTPAERELKRALELAPGSSDAHIFYGLLLSALGRHDEALREGQTAVQLDPLSPNVSLLGRIFYYSRRYEEAVPYHQRGIELEPRNARAYFRLGDTYAQMGRFDEAIAAYEKVRGLAPDSPFIPAGIAYVYARTGRHKEARQIIAASKADAASVAQVYAALGDKDEAFRVLEKGVEKHQIAFYINGDPRYEPLYSDPRWTELLRRMNYPAS